MKFGMMAVIADLERRRITRRMDSGQLEEARQGKLAKRIQAVGYPGNRAFEAQAKWARFIRQES